MFAQNGFAFQSTEDSTVLLRERAGFLAFPAPNDKELAQLTRQVAANNGFDRSDKTEADKRLFAELRRHIKHVVYIVKENRSYDQILGDLEIGDGDPRLTLFPESLTPNHHALARIFVVLDNFLVSGEGSWTGWQWSTAGRTSVFAERNDFVNLAQRGGGDRQEPLNPSDPDDLAGDRDADEFDGPHGELGQGYLWDSALRAGKTVRSYGFWAWSNKSPALREPFREGVKTAVTTIPSLAPYSDPYMPPAIRVPDFWRIREWKREFDGYIKSGDLPDLVLIQLPGDHFGQYQTVLDGVDTPDKQMADNDYALGTIIEAVAKSRFADSTLVIAIEDDTWDGVDHVDAFRSPIFLAGPYVKQGGTLISTRYTTVNVIKTITELLGAGPVSINDAIATPMTEVFDLSRQNWTYQANVPDILYSTKLPLPPRSGSIASCVLNAEHDAAYWAKAMAEQDDSHIDAGRFGTGNQALWLGLKGDQPYPETRTGENLRSNRDVLLAASRAKVREICLGTRGLVRASSPFPGGEVPQK